MRWTKRWGRDLCHFQFGLFSVQYSLACTKQNVFLIGNVTSFGQREEKHKKWIRQQIADMRRWVTSKEVIFLRNKLTIALLRRRLWRQHAKHDFFYLVSMSDIHACNISLFMPANWFFLKWMLSSSVSPYFVLSLFIARLSYSLQSSSWDKVPGSKVSIVPGMAQRRRICAIKWVLQHPIKIRPGISLLLRNSIIQFIFSTHSTISMKDEFLCVWGCCLFSIFYSWSRGSAAKGMGRDTLTCIPRGV